MSAWSMSGGRKEASLPSDLPVERVVNLSQGNFENLQVSYRNLELEGVILGHRRSYEIVEILFRTESLVYWISSDI
jgi:hypothetical protein